MKFHKKLGVFEACKKVWEDFFDTLKKPHPRVRFLYHHLFETFSAKPGKSFISMTLPSSRTALPVNRPNT